MNTSMQQQIAELMGGIADAQRRMQSAQAAVAQSSATARSKNRLVTVTADARGNVTALKFNSTGYRTMSPTELAQVILDTIADARGRVNDQVQGAVRTIAPGGDENTQPFGSGLSSLLDVFASSGGRPSPEQMFEVVRGRTTGGAAEEKEAGPKRAIAVRPATASPAPAVESAAADGYTGERQAVTKKVKAPSQRPSK